MHFLNKIFNFAHLHAHQLQQQRTWDCLQWQKLQVSKCPLHCSKCRHKEVIYDSCFRFENALNLASTARKVTPCFAAILAGPRKFNAIVVKALNGTASQWKTMQHNAASCTFRSVLKARKGYRFQKNLLSFFSRLQNLDFGCFEQS